MVTLGVIWLQESPLGMILQEKWCVHRANQFGAASHLSAKLSTVYWNRTGYEGEDEHINTSFF